MREQRNVTRSPFDRKEHAFLASQQRTSFKRSMRKEMWEASPRCDLSHLENKSYQERSEGVKSPHGVRKGWAIQTKGWAGSPEPTWKSWERWHMLVMEVLWWGRWVNPWGSLGSRSNPLSFMSFGPVSDPISKKDGWNIRNDIRLSSGLPNKHTHTSLTHMPHTNT